jgi:hypothetical protein
LDALDRLVESNRSNIQYRSFVDVEETEAERVAELVFSGIRQQWTNASPGNPRQAVRRFHRVVLRVDDHDRNAAINGMPSYVAYGLRHSATKLVQCATVLYRNLRRHGTLQNGYAFCGRLTTAFDNDGKPIPPPDGMIYVVFADPDGYVFDWDWVREHPHHPGHPVDPELRFSGNPEPAVPETILVGVEDINPAPRFDPRPAWVSEKGDCIFCYFSDEFAFADRIDDDLTVFRSVATKEPTGFKVKNVGRMLEEKKVRLTAPDVMVEVQAFLLASLLRNPEKIEVYSILIGAWIRQTAHAEPPKIKLPGRSPLCPAVA